MKDASFTMISLIQNIRNLMKLCYVFLTSRKEEKAILVQVMAQHRIDSYLEYGDIIS